MPLSSWRNMDKSFYFLTCENGTHPQGVMAKFKWDEANRQLWRTTLTWQVTATSVASSVILFGLFLWGWGFLDSSVGKESTCNAGDPSLIPGSGRSPGAGIGYPLQYPWASLVAQLVQNTRNVGDLGLIPGLGRSPGEGKGHPPQYSGLENSMDCIVHGLQRVRHDWATFTFTPGVRCGQLSWMLTFPPSGHPWSQSSRPRWCEWALPTVLSCRYVGSLWPRAAQLRKSLSRKKRVFTFFFIILAKINSLILYIYGTSTLLCRGWFWFLSFKTDSPRQLRMCVFPPNLEKYVDWWLDWSND